jgi:Zn-dependent protease with chaperone function
MAPEARAADPLCGRAVYYDGVSAARHDVTIELAPTALRIRDGDGAVLGEWAFDSLESLSAPDDMLRLGRAHDRVLARLEIRDPQLIGAIDRHSVLVDRTHRIERRLRGRIIFWSIAATASLVLVAIVGMPRLAAQIAPLVPYTLEHKFGTAIERQARTALGSGQSAGVSFECGGSEAEQPGRLAFAKLMQDIEIAAGLPLPLSAVIVRRAEANAITLPGGYIFAFKGLLDKAETPDEFAGVIAHEVGHVAHRDGVRTAVETAGLSFLFGMVLGDFVGGSAVIIAARALLQNGYSRDVEAAADAYSVTLMSKMGGDPKALAAILLRIAGSTHPGPKLLTDHPDTRDRIAAIETMAKPGPRRELLTEPEWLALKSICSRAAS